MRLDEIFSRHDYRQDLKKQRIRRLGGGAFADVFQHPVYHNVVVKVVGYSDTGYKRYLQWALQHQDNRYVPKIAEVVEKKVGTHSLQFVFMKKMDRVRPTEEDLEFYLVRALQQGRKGQQKKDIEQAYLQRAGSTDRDVLKAVISVAKEIGDRDLAEVLSFFLRNHRLLDLHWGNMMMDGNQLIFTDPFASDRDIPHDQHPQDYL
jgi:hypothetical protein